MTRKMLIDATHAEETRVVVVDGNKVDEFDFESLNKRQLAGNIYLAKVTRVEPSLQAAFVDYGGNRHGFLAFSEIHPDYYQIPKADRDALIAEEAALSRETEEEAPREKPKSRSRSRRRAQPAAEGLGADDAVVASEPLPSEADDGGAKTEGTEAPSGEPAPRTGTASEGTESQGAGPEGGVEAVATPAESVAAGEEASGETPGGQSGEPSGEKSETRPLDDAPPPNTASGEVEIRVAAEPEGTPDLVPVETPRDDDEPEQPKPRRKSRAKARDAEEDDEAEETEYESVGGDDVSDERPQRKQVRHRRYKIQEVIKVRQILLVQVVKEERGNKGAALTTYLSLAGRYCVLMPNTARGGGISRKITNAADRKKLKEISNSITVPEGAGLIIRTAGANRTKTEIRRDYEYLLRQWEQIRELTLKSIAPAPIYEEGSLIKRAIRDLYSRDIDEVLVDGERGYREAKDYMKMLMPSHAKNVKHYNEALPLFSRFQVENYLSAMFNPVVQLKSGGYIVIDVTEALVAIDVNSGRATREASIEETALKTNLEAAEEAARQMRLRDLAGLIVIDFIDMEDRRNNAAVEKRLKEKLKSDRARIQVGRISGFGLLEMSRQRLRPGMIEATTKPCAHCHGTGRVRSDDSLALALLREVEEEGVRQRSKEVLIVAPVEIANYLLNQKREHIALVESRFGLSVRVEGDPMLISPDFKLERFKTASRLVPAPTALVLPPVAYPEDDFSEEDGEEEAEAAENGAAQENGDASGEKQGKRKRRRRRRGGRGAEDQARDAQSVEDVREVETPTSLPADVMEPVEDGVEGIVAEPRSDAEAANGGAGDAGAAEAKQAPRARSRRRSRGASSETPPATEGLGEVIDLGEGTSPGIVEVPETAPAPRKRERVRRPAPTAAPADTRGEEAGATASASSEDAPTEDPSEKANASAETLLAPDTKPDEAVGGGAVTGVPPTSEEAANQDAAPDAITQQAASQEASAADTVDGAEGSEGEPSETGSAESTTETTGTGSADTGHLDAEHGGARVTASEDATSDAAISEAAAVDAPEISSEGRGGLDASDDFVGMESPAAESPAEAPTSEPATGSAGEAEHEPAPEPAAPDFEPEAPVPDLAGFESPMEAPVPFDVPYESPYETLSAETPPEDPIPGAPDLAEAAEGAPESARGSDTPGEAVAIEPGLEPAALAEDGDAAPPVIAGGDADAAETPNASDSTETGFEPDAGGADEHARPYESAVAADTDAEDQDPAPKRRGWWSRG